MNCDDEIVKAILGQFSGSVISENDITKVQNYLYAILGQYDITPKKNEITVVDKNQNESILKSFMVAKKIEGLSDNSLRTYSIVIKDVAEYLDMPYLQMTTNDIRRYLAHLEIDRGVSKSYVDSARRYLSSFYKTLVDEELISKNPMAKIKKIKVPKVIKKAFSDEEIEKLRDNSVDQRDLAIIDFLLSTGVRVSELCSINKNDIKDDQCTVLGKGKKERIVYLNAKAKYSLDKYLETRNDDNPALFVSLDEPHERLHKSAIEILMRKYTKICGIKDKVHPHRFRRTFATNALKRGMPVEQVSLALGHSDLSTTMIYLDINQEDIKQSHKKYVV